MGYFIQKLPVKNLILFLLIKNSLVNIKSRSFQQNSFMSNIIMGFGSWVLGFPGGSVVKNPPANAGDAGDMGSIPESGSFPGVESGKLLQYSCLGNPMDRGAWQAAVHRVTKNWT